MVVKFIAIFAVNISPIRPLFSPSKWIKSSRYNNTSQQLQSNYAAHGRSSRVGDSRFSSKVCGQDEFIELGSSQSVERIIESGQDVYADTGAK